MQARLYIIDTVQHRPTPHRPTLSRHLLPSHWPGRAALTLQPALHYSFLGRPSVFILPSLYMLLLPFSRAVQLFQWPSLCTFPPPDFTLLRQPMPPPHPPLYPRYPAHSLHSSVLSLLHRLCFSSLLCLVSSQSKIFSRRRASKPVIIQLYRITAVLSQRAGHRSCL